MNHKLKPRTWPGVAVALGGLALLRLWICTRFELVGDEAYYWQWSRNLDWCYYSKGPLVAWTIRLGTRLFGNTELGVRCFSIALGTATPGLLYWLTRRLFNRRVAAWTLLLAVSTPLFVIGGMLMTIDPLFIFFWMAASCCFWRAKNTDHIGPWLATGLLVGVGMLAKYTNVALLPSFALFLAWSPPYRNHLRKRTFWMMALSALACLAPVLWWNAHHDWITVTHLQERGALDRAWRLSGSEFLEFLGGQAGAYTPLFFLGILFSLCHQRVRREAPVAYRFTASLTIPLLAFYSILALNDAGEANWTAAAIMSALPLLAATWSTLGASSRIARTAAWVAVVPAVVLSAIVLLAPATTFPGIEPLLYRIRGWDSLAQQVETFAEEEGASLILGDHYQTASLLAFYMEGHPDTYIVNRPRIQNQYSFWPTYGAPQEGEHAVYVSRDAHPAHELYQQFMRIDPPRAVQTQWHGRPVRTFYLHPCRRYKGDG